jgi:hypothetical protein
VGIFGRDRERRLRHPEALPDGDENTELAAAEAFVNTLPDPPPSTHPFVDVILGTRPRMVSFPTEDERSEDAESVDS